MLFIALCLLFSCDSSTPEADVIPSGERYDSVTNTYYVNSESGLKKWAEAAKSDPSTNCVLLSDITLSNPSKDVSNWSPVAKYTGTFDGQYHTITDVSVVISTNEPGTQDYGFFRSIASGGVIRNLNLENVYVRNLTGNIGAIAGFSSNGTIENCTASGNVIAGALRAGGIVGDIRSNSSISNCINECTVTSLLTNPMVGGIVGNAGNSAISNCKNFGDLRPDGYLGVYGGGIAGQIRNTKVTSCLNSGSILGEDSKYFSDSRYEEFYLGGIVGKASGSSITDCKVEGCTIEATYNSDYVDIYSFGSIVGNGEGADSSNTGTATIKKTPLEALLAMVKVLIQAIREQQQ